MVQEKIGLTSVKKIFYVLTIGVCLLAACKKSSPNNNVEEELIAKAKAGNPTCICDPYIKKYQWKGKIVYMQYIRGSMCNGIPFFYDSNGEELNLRQEVTYDEFLAGSTFIEVVWTCSYTAPQQ